MSDGDFYQPSDADLLRMENELLALENRFLKAKLATAARSGPGAGGAGSERPLGDMQWLLRRLGGSPVGPLLRRREAWRTLETRYLKAPPSMTPAERRSHAQLAERDLQRLVQRLDASPAGPLLRTQGG
ncbi:MAG: hypothetical protein M3N17_03945, partial [Actinomycetota bacterium]|nr:hypothetical protein [Actinomycetota bacterium]